MSNLGFRHIVMSGKLCVCVFGILFPQQKPHTKEDLEIPEKEFILSVKLVGPNSETGIEEESHNSGFRVAIISIPIHPTLQCLRLVQAREEDTEKTKVKSLKSRIPNNFVVGIL